MPDLAARSVRCECAIVAAASEGALSGPYARYRLRRFAAPSSAAKSPSYPDQGPQEQKSGGMEGYYLLR